MVKIFLLPRFFSFNFAPSCHRFTPNMMLRQKPMSTRAKTTDTATASNDARKTITDEVLASKSISDPEHIDTKPTSNDLSCQITRYGIVTTTSHNTESSAVSRTRKKNCELDQLCPDEDRFFRRHVVCNGQLHFLWLCSDNMPNHVEPRQKAMKNCPQHRFIDAPGDSNRQSGAKRYAISCCFAT
jgi:hypothetical protein